MEVSALIGPRGEHRSGNDAWGPGQDPRRATAVDWLVPTRAGATRAGSTTSLGRGCTPFRTRWCAICTTLVLFLATLATCGSSSDRPSAPASEAARVGPVYGLWFRRDASSNWQRAASPDSARMVGGGLAAADYDGDGDIDFYVVGGGLDPNHLYENQNGTFVERAEAVGLALTEWGSGPVFGDIDADGDLDLFIGGMNNTKPRVLENRLTEPEGRFVDVTAASGIRFTARNTVSATLFDYDGDGWLDLATTHWANPIPGNDPQTLWRNNGDGTFSSATVPTGIAATLFEDGSDYTFTANFTDIDDDGDGDLLMSADYGESQVFRNNGDGTFANITDNDVIVDQFGMGGAVGDFDNDGDMDWFVTSIYNLDEGGRFFGNRMYRNDGSGVFSDATRGVADGGWAWGACAADFDNDGALDIAQVNGWTTEAQWDFSRDNVRLFHNVDPAKLAFVERASEAGISNLSQGRGIACFDMNRDGLLDIVISNNAEDNVVVYRNETRNANNYLSVRLDGQPPNHFGIGARITVTTANASQIRQLGGTSNFASHDPLEAHFGLGYATRAHVHVLWPDGTATSTRDVQANQQITLAQRAALRLVVRQGAGTGIYEAGDEIAVSAAPPASGYHFSHWTSVGGGILADPRAADTTFVMPDGPATVTAHYLPGVSPSTDVSAARRWSEVLLQAIRNDYARPTVHARNLFHLSAAMYDAWAAYDPTDQPASPWLLGRGRADSHCSAEGVSAPDDVEEARRAALSYAAYRLIRHRFHASPGSGQIRLDADALMGHFGYDVEVDDTDLELGPAALGNHIGRCYVDFGLVDGANEANDYANIAYEPVNEALEPAKPGNPGIKDLNRWQPLALAEFIDQAGNPSDSEPEFLGPEWGSVVPFALAEEDLTVHERDGYEYWVYHDPGEPPKIGGDDAGQYKWSHARVAEWSSHLDPTDGVTWDISPASLGNNASYPGSFADHAGFFPIDGGDQSRGHETNPATGAPYEPQVVPRGDYTRVLAEFWADGPDSETPPGHWFVILNEVNDHAMLRRRFQGEGPELGLLEWDVKAYFALGGAMHDAAIAAWGIKGWYDYIRPISSLRAMADRGQGSDAEGASYHVDGIVLRTGYIEVIETGDELAGTDDEHVGKIKLFAWRGPDAIDNPDTDVAGVGWILAENWWPYQRPSFVTPPFAGYVSGHSTYSRAAAEVLTALTGDAYFPGGMSDFEIRANEFLVFENGPSVDMTLQWATYRDASDQCSLSRIWGGIHPPADDIPGRLIGIEVGNDAFALAVAYYEGTDGQNDSSSP